MTQANMVPGSKRLHLCAALLFFGSLALNLQHIYMVSSPLDHVYSDMGGYVTRAWRVAAGAPFMPFDTFYPPGTSFLFAVVFFLFGFPVGIHIVSISQAVFLAGANVLLGYVAMELFGHRLMACLVMLIATLYWPFTAQTSFFMAEPAFSFFVILGLLVFVRSINRPSNQFVYFVLGLLFGIVTLIKSQGLCVFVIIPLSMFVFTRTRHLRQYIVALLSGLLIPVVMTLALNAAIMRSPGLLLSANAAFNTYLGQSRHQALGCLDPDKGYFYYFHNNNAGIGYDFLPPRVLPVSILDRAYFNQETAKLWREDPTTQIIRSLHNVVELFEINPRWPLRNNSHLVRQDVVSQWILLFFVVLPAVYGIWEAVFCKRYCFQVSILALPLVGISAVVSVSMGQPRYLIPFTYFLILLAVPFYLDLLEAARNYFQRKLFSLGRT